MKTVDELNALKEEVGTLKNKLAELTDDELKQVTGGETELDLFHFDANPDDFEHKHSIRNIYTAD